MMERRGGGEGGEDPLSRVPGVSSFGAKGRLLSTGCLANWLTHRLSLGPLHNIKLVLETLFVVSHGR